MNIKIDSRKVKDGDIFVGIKTLNNDGNDYAFDAIKKGAAKIVIEGNKDILIVPNTRVYLSKLLKNKYEKEMNKIKLIGVTGTNGKTTTCFLIYQALNMLGIKCAYIGTIGFYMDKFICNISNTTPEILDLYEMILKCINNNYEYVVMEVSSHALSLGRVSGLLFDTAILTNITQDHLDYHKNMNEYAKCKSKLFDMCNNAIINLDSNYSCMFFKDKNNNYTYGEYDGKYRISDIKTYSNYSTFKLNDISYKTKLIGKYNIYNIVNVIILLDILGVCNKEKKNIIKNLNAPCGRMDTIKYKSNKIIIDYAHTPDAVLNIINTSREITKGKLYVIVGCGGNRDKTKRSIMANICVDNTDFSIFTTDNPRYENQDSIFSDMVSNITCDNYKIIYDRESAIKYGISLLNNNDTLLILGKGHEDYQIIGDKKIHFDDKEIVKKYINML